MKRAFYKQQADQRANKPPLYSDRTRRNQPTIFSTVMKIPRPFRHQHGVCMHLKLRIDCLSQIDLNYPRPQLLSQRASVRRPSAALCPHMASICSSQRCFTLCNLGQTGTRRLFMDPVPGSASLSGSCWVSSVCEVLSATYPASGSLFKQPSCSSNSPTDKRGQQPRRWDHPQLGC